MRRLLTILLVVVLCCRNTLDRAGAVHRTSAPGREGRLLQTVCFAMRGSVENRRPKDRPWQVWRRQKPKKGSREESRRPKDRLWRRGSYDTAIESFCSTCHVLPPADVQPKSRWRGRIDLCTDSPRDRGLCKRTASRRWTK